MPSFLPIRYCVPLGDFYSKLNENDPTMVDMLLNKPSWHNLPVNWQEENAMRLVSGYLDKIARKCI